MKLLYNLLLNIICNDDYNYVLPMYTFLGTSRADYNYKINWNLLLYENWKLNIQFVIRISVFSNRYKDNMFCCVRLGAFKTN